MSDTEQQTLNLPSLIIVVIIVGLSIRYFFFSPSSNNIGSSSNRGRAADPAHVDQLQQMFPQLNRRDIQWDLQRNGGSVQATTERVLGGRGLERVSLFIIGVGVMDVMAWGVVGEVQTLAFDESNQKLLWKLSSVFN